MLQQSVWELWSPAFVAGTEIGKIALLALFFPLYTRLRKKDILEHFVRGRIYGYIEANPGEHYSEILRKLGMKNGALAYHLSILEKEGFVNSYRDGMYKRYYPKGMKLTKKTLNKNFKVDLIKEKGTEPENDGIRLSNTQEKIIEAIQNNQGISQKEIAKIVDTSKQNVNYHIKLMLNANMIRKDENGRMNYFVNKSDFTD